MDCLSSTLNGLVGVPEVDEKGIAKPPAPSSEPGRKELSNPDSYDGVEGDTSVVADDAKLPANISG